MSSRTIARSSSNMNSASARASSVLPTPVGPRKTNEPIGRFGSCRPVRERLSALATASTASPWPTTRWCRRSSMWISFSVSPSSSLSTGMPVQLERARVDLHAEAGSRLVDEVDRLVGEEAVGDVPVGEDSRGDERRVADADAVVGLIALLEAAQDGDRVRDGRLADEDRLEAP